MSRCGEAVFVEARLANRLSGQCWSISCAEHTLFLCSLCSYIISAGVVARSGSELGGELVSVLSTKRAGQC